jgi:hypothetical protein
MPQSLTDDNDTFYQRNTTTKSKVLFITNKYTTQSKVLLITNKYITQSKVPPPKKTNKYHHNNKGFPKNKEQTIECSNLIQTSMDPHMIKLIQNLIYIPYLHTRNKILPV